MKVDFNHVPFETLKGMTLKRVAINPKNEEIQFFSECGRNFLMHHMQECCESVIIEDVCGDLDWLIGQPLLVCEERTNVEVNDDGSKTWTFYEMATINGSVTIRWYGTSNGYYSETVNFSEIIEKEKYKIIQHQG